MALTAELPHQKNGSFGLGHQRHEARRVCSRRSLQIRALFTTKERVAAPKKEKEETSTFFSLSFPGKNKNEVADARGAKTVSKKLDKAAEYKKRQGFGGIISAFDFAETRSKSDAELLYDAKYGERANDGKMTREQVSGQDVFGYILYCMIFVSCGNLRVLIRPFSKEYFCDILYVICR